MNPLLLDFGIHPQAAAATSTLMVLFTSSSAALSFGFSHQLNLQFALVFGLCCMAASLVGVILVLSSARARWAMLMYSLVKPVCMHLCWRCPIMQTCP